MPANPTFSNDLLHYVGTWGIHWAENENWIGTRKAYALGVWHTDAMPTVLSTYHGRQFPVYMPPMLWMIMFHLRWVEGGGIDRTRRIDSSLWGNMTYLNPVPPDQLVDPVTDIVATHSLCGNSGSWGNACTGLYQSGLIRTYVPDADEILASYIHPYLLSAFNDDINLDARSLPDLVQRDRGIVGPCGRVCRVCTGLRKWSDLTNEEVLNLHWPEQCAGMRHLLTHALYPGAKITNHPDHFSNRPVVCKTITPILQEIQWL